MTIQMKTKYKMLTCLALLCAGVNQSCTDNLDVAPVSVITEASYWKSENDANGALNGLYVLLRRQASENLYLWGEGRSEVMGLGVQGSGGRERYHDNSLDVTTAGPNWLGMYYIVHQANLILKYVPQITFTSEATKNNILAQAYTMRAFTYFTMAKTWGDLPLVTEPTEGYDPASIQKPRTPVKEIFSFVKEDIDKATQLFGESNALAQGRQFWSKPALNALKADVFLWTAKRLGGGEADFNTALTAITEAEKADISLLPKFEDVFDYTNKGNKEILMAVRFKDIEVTDNHYSLMYFPQAFLPSDLDAATKAAIGLPAGQNYWAPSATIRSQFTADDSRKNASFIEVYTSASGTQKFVGSLAVKFNGFVNSGIRLFLDDVILYRYADLLLMKAEAKNALGQDPSAEINKVRERAYGAAYKQHVFVSGSKDANDEAILRERLFELVFEGKRWWDLVRFGKAFEKIPSLKDRAGKDYLLLFPISEATLSLEPQVKQNPGY